MTKRLPSNGMGDVPFEQRVLLLPHCLRPSQTCPGKMTRQGMDCTGCTLVECAIYQLRAVADEAGYEGICVAPGGRLAARFLSEHQPTGIIAVACHKEIEEGLEAIEEMEWSNGHPTVSVIPLSLEGCVDTEVDLTVARAAILNRNGHDS